MQILRYILFPISLLYWLVTSIRNFLFNRKVYKEYAFDIPVLNVGNLTVGGTGKTPFVEYLIRIFKSDKNLAVLSRGYGRKTSGFILADNTADAEKIGDEPMQYFTKYGGEIAVAVGEDRVQSVPGIFASNEDTDLIILDDAYQHRFIKPSFNILLTKFNNLFYKDYLLPTGNLRESRKGAKRADVVIVTKCPEILSDNEKAVVRKAVTKYSGEKPVFFCGINYEDPKPVFNYNNTFKDSVFLFSGIANDVELREYVANKYKLVHVVSFPDHYKYSRAVIEKLIKTYREKGNGAMLLTTEKDMVKLQPFQDMLNELPLFYLPISITFQENEEAFIKLIKEQVY